MLSRSSVAVAGGRIVLQQKAKASALLSSGLQTRRTYSQSRPGDLSSIPLNLKKARKSATADISTALPVSETQLPKAQAKPRRAREMPTATSFQDIFIPTSQFAQPNQPKGDHDPQNNAPPSTLPSRLKPHSDVASRRRRVPSNSGAQEQSPLRRRDPSRVWPAKGETPKRMRIAKAEWSTLKEQQVEVPAEKKKEVQLKLQTEQKQKAKEHEQEEEEDGDGDLVRDKVQESFYVQDVDASTNLDRIFDDVHTHAQAPAQPQSPVLAAPAEPIELPATKNSPLINMTLEAEVTAAMEQSAIQIPNARVNAVATRSQLLLESNGGDYSRHAGVYKDIALQWLPTVDALGTVGLAELYLSKQPGASIEARRHALGIVRKMTSKRTGPSVGSGSKEIAS